MSGAEVRRHRTRSRGVIGLVVVLACVGALGLGDSTAFLVTTAAVYSLLALSLNPVLGGVGLLSMCQLTFAAAGAVVVGALSGHLPFLLSLAIAGLVAVPAGALLGGVSLRLRGASFAVASLGVATAGQVVLSHTTAAGFQSADSVLRPALFQSTSRYLWLCLAVLALAGVAVTCLRGSLLGHRWAAVDFSERAAAAAGTSVTAAKLTAAASGAAVAAVAGGLMVGQYGFLTADSVAPIGGLMLVAVAMVGGVDYVAGALAAGAIVVFVPELFSRWGLPGDLAPILFGIAAIWTLKVGGGGIAGQVSDLWRMTAARRRLSADRVIPPAPAEPGVARVVPSCPNATDSAAPATAALELRGLTVTYGAVLALRDVTLGVARGSVTGLIGPNGAGKSTLVDVVTGFVVPDHGEVVLDGHSLAGKSVTRRARMGLRRTFQQGRAIPALTIRDYLDLCAGRRLDPAEISALVEALGTPEPATTIARVDVSTRRLIEVAGALASNPSVVLLDEPAAGLSGSDAEQLARRIRCLPELFGVSVLVIEHDVQLIREACDTVHVLNFGELIASGAPEDVLAQADVVEAYLGVNA
jgi:branched-chain amino acid transport system permease protein